jgi:hypothetical protein
MCEGYTDSRRLARTLPQGPALLFKVPRRKEQRPQFSLPGKSAEAVSQQ